MSMNFVTKINEFGDIECPDFATEILGLEPETDVKISIELLCERKERKENLIIPLSILEKAEFDADSGIAVTAADGRILAIKADYEDAFENGDFSAMNACLCGRKYSVFECLGNYYENSDGEKMVIPLEYLDYADIYDYENLRVYIVRNSVVITTDF